MDLPMPKSLLERWPRQVARIRQHGGCALVYRGTAAAPARNGVIGRAGNLLDEGGTPGRAA